MGQLGRTVVLLDNSMYMSGYNCSTICTLSINLSRIYMIRRIVMQVDINVMCSSCYCYGYWSEFIEYCYFRYALVCNEAGGLYMFTWSMARSRVQNGCNDRKDWIRIVWFEFLGCYCLRSNLLLWVVSYFCERFMSDGVAVCLCCSQGVAFDRMDLC